MPDEEIIYHITSNDLWMDCLENGEYRCESLEKDGFIHFSLNHQVLATANRYYQGVSGLVLLQVNIKRLCADLKYETAPSGELFPHLYGALNLDAVEKVSAFTPDVDGVFAHWPE